MTTYIEYTVDKNYSYHLDFEELSKFPHKHN